VTQARVLVGFPFRMTCTCLYLIFVSLGGLPPSCGELGEIVRGVVTGLCGGGRLSTGEAHAPLCDVRRRPCTRAEWKCLEKHWEQVIPTTGRGVAWGISGGPSGPMTAIQGNQRIHRSTSRFTTVTIRMSDPTQSTGCNLCPLN